MIDLGITYSGTTYPEVVDEKINGKKMKFIPYNIVENNGIYFWEYIQISSYKYNYGELVNTIIGLKYNLQETLAIMNNYLAAPKNQKYKTEFDELQQCRKDAKDFAKKHFNMINE